MLYLLGIFALYGQNVFTRLLLYVFHFMYFVNKLLLLLLLQS